MGFKKLISFVGLILLAVKVSMTENYRKILDSRLPPQEFNFEQVKQKRRY